LGGVGCNSEGFLVRSCIGPTLSLPSKSIDSGILQVGNGVVFLNMPLRNMLRSLPKGRIVFQPSFTTWPKSLQEYTFRIKQKYPSSPLRVNNNCMNSYNVHDGSRKCYLPGEATHSLLNFFIRIDVILQFDNSVVFFDKSFLIFMSHLQNHKCGFLTNTVLLQSVEILFQGLARSLL